MTNVEALKALYTALGGDAADVADASTIVSVLNAIAAKYEGESDAILNPEAIANITAVIDNIIPEPVLVTKSITVNGTYSAADDNADGYSSVNVNVPATPSENNAKFGTNPESFAGITNITNIDIPNGVTSIASQAFNNCKQLISVTIPSTVTELKQGAFNWCNHLTDVQLVNGLTVIGAEAFSQCQALSTITIPSTVTSIGSNSFSGCANLTSIIVHKTEGSLSGAPWGATNATVTWTG